LYSAFYRWAEGYAPGLQLDHRYSNGNYETENRRFVTLLVSANNRRSNRRITYPGETLHVEDEESDEVAGFIVHGAIVIRFLRINSWIAGKKRFSQGLQLGSRKLR
jgi:hypothetical protein